PSPVGRAASVGPPAPLIAGAALAPAPPPLLTAPGTFFAAPPSVPAPPAVAAAVVAGAPAAPAPGVGLLPRRVLPPPATTGHQTEPQKAGEPAPPRKENRQAQAVYRHPLGDVGDRSELRGL